MDGQVFALNAWGALTLHDHIHNTSLRGCTQDTIAMHSLSYTTFSTPQEPPTNKYPDSLLFLACLINSKLSLELQNI